MANKSSDAVSGNNPVTRRRQRSAPELIAGRFALWNPAEDGGAAGLVGN